MDSLLQNTISSHHAHSRHRSVAPRPAKPVPPEAAQPAVKPGRVDLGVTALSALARARDADQRKRFRALASVVLQKIAEETSASIAVHCLLGRIAPAVLRGLIAAGHSNEACRLCSELYKLELVSPVRLADYPEASDLLREVQQGLASYETRVGRVPGHPV